MDNIYPIPQLHGENFAYLRPPHLHVGYFDAPHLSSVLSVPSNPSELLATQLAAQFLAQDRLFGVDLLKPVPVFRGRTPARATSERRAQTPAPRVRSERRTPGGASSNQVEHMLGQTHPPHFTPPPCFLTEHYIDLRTSDPALAIAAAKEARFARQKRKPHTESEKRAARQLRADRYCEDFMSFYSAGDAGDQADILSLKQM